MFFKLNSQLNRRKLRKKKYIVEYFFLSETKKGGEGKNKATVYIWMIFQEKRSSYSECDVISMEEYRQQNKYLSMQETDGDCLGQ